jgi:hypothetical protein
MYFRLLITRNNIALFARFGKILFIENNYIYKIDCQFDHIAESDIPLFFNIYDNFHKLS